MQDYINAIHINNLYSINKNKYLFYKKQNNKVYWCILNNKIGFFKNDYFILDALHRYIKVYVCECENKKTFKFKNKYGYNLIFSIPQLTNFFKGV